MTIGASTFKEQEQNLHLRNLYPCPRQHQDKVCHREQLQNFQEAVFVRSYGASRDGLLRETEKIIDTKEKDNTNDVTYRLHDGSGVFQI